MIIKTNDTLLGPFLNIEDAEDYLLADGVHYYKTVLGDYQIINTDPPGNPINYVWADNTYSLKPLTASELSTYRKVVSDKIIAERENRRDNGGYIVDGHWFNSDTSSKIEQGHLAARADKIAANGGDLSAQLMIGDTPVLWKTLDNGWVPMTGNLAIAVQNTAEETTVKIYTAAATHLYLVSISNDPLNYDYSTLWPTAFTD